MSRALYMLDTDTASFFLRGRYPSIDARLKELDGSEFCISVITRAELMYGLQLAAPTHQAHLRVRRFLAGIAILDWDQAAADAYAALRYQMKVQGTPVAEPDMMIAAHAMSLGAVLVTNNTRHFQHMVPPLVIENWVSPDAG